MMCIKLHLVARTCHFTDSISSDTLCFNHDLSFLSSFRYGICIYRYELWSSWVDPTFNVMECFVLELYQGEINVNDKCQP